MNEDRFPLILLRMVVPVLAWYAMEAVHELGHVIGAGGRVAAVHIPLVGFSMTEYEDGIGTVRSIACGPALGATMPLILLLAPRRRLAGRIARFFAGFCLVANGAYMLAGAYMNEGDAGDLIGFGVTRVSIMVPALLALGLGLWVLHRNGRWAGLAMTADR
jgi:hypothetical protein